jgi:ABC-type amino acid transport substrate-binding protein
MIARAVISLFFLLLPAVAGAAREKNVESRELIIVGGNSAYPPYEFLDKDGKPAGFVVELTQAIADTMGFDVRIRLGKSWTNMRRALEKGEVDVLEGISFSEDRAKILDFSPPHSLVSHSIFTRTGAPPVGSLEELHGKEVIVMGRGVMYDYFVEAGYRFSRSPSRRSRMQSNFLPQGTMSTPWWPRSRERTSSTTWASRM